MVARGVVTSVVHVRGRGAVHGADLLLPTLLTRVTVTKPAVKGPAAVRRVTAFVAPVQATTSTAACAAEAVACRDGDRLPGAG